MSEQHNPEIVAESPENRPTEEILGSIAVAAAAVENAKQELVVSVAMARRAEFSWSAIGKTLGITRQAAWERFSDAVIDHDTE